MKSNGFMGKKKTMGERPRRPGRAAQELVQRGYSRKPVAQQQSMRGSITAYDAEEGLMTISLYRSNDA